MSYWIKSVLDEQGEPSREVVIVDDDDVVMARGGLRVSFEPADAAISAETQCSVRFVGMMVEHA